MQQGWFSRVAVVVVFLLSAISLCGHAAGQTSPKQWMNPSLSPDQRADMVVAQMTEAEKLQMVHGILRPSQGQTFSPSR